MKRCIRFIIWGIELKFSAEPHAAEEIISISKSFNIDAQIIGRTEESSKKDNQNHLTIRTDDKKLCYG